MTQHETSPTLADRSSRFNICATKRIEGVTPDGAVLEWQAGCNGTRHVNSLLKLWIGDGEEVMFADEVLFLNVGECNCCDCLRSYLGVFRYSPDSNT